MANNSDNKKDSSNNSENSGSGTAEKEKLTETIKKIISAGGPSEISKEIFSTVLGQALKAKDDVTLKVSNEMISLVRKIDFVKEFSKFAENHKFKVTAEIEITKKEQDPKS